MLRMPCKQILRRLAPPAVLLACILTFTWPLLFHLGEAIPAGSEPPTVSLHQLFLAEWNARFLGGDTPGDGTYWNAPFFHPHDGTFAWSEPQPLAGLLTFLLRCVGLSSTLAYNLLLVAYLLFAGIAVALLAQQLTGDRFASWLCGCSVACGGCMLHQLGVLHLLALGFPAWFLLCLFRLRDEQRALTFVLLGCAYAGTWLSCAQFGLLLTLLTPIAFFSAVPLRRLGWKGVGKLALTAAIAAAAILPFLLLQSQKLAAMGFSRTLADVRGNFSWVDLILPARGHWLTGRLLGFDLRTDVYCWDVGVVNLVVMLTGVVWWLRKRIRLERERIPLARTYLLLALAALLLGFGPRLGFTINGTSYGPYALLAAVVPGLQGMRSPARLGLFLFICVAILAALALAELRRRATTPRRRRLLSAVVALAGVAEAFTMPIQLARTGEALSGLQQATEWLAATGDSGPVLELPVASGFRPADFEGEVRAMHRLLQHGHPLINGYAAYFPPPNQQLAYALLNDPAGSGLRYLRAMGTRYVLIHEPGVGPDILAAVRAASTGSHSFGDGMSILEMPPSPAVQPVRIPDHTKLRQPLAEGYIIRARLPSPTEEALLLLPAADSTIEATWQDPTSASWETVILHVRGSVLLDRGTSRVNLLVTRLPLLGKRGEARLISEEEVQQIEGRKS